MFIHKKGCFYANFETDEEMLNFYIAGFKHNAAIETNEVKQYWQQRTKMTKANNQTVYVRNTKYALKMTKLCHYFQTRMLWAGSSEDVYAKWKDESEDYNMQHETCHNRGPRSNVRNGKITIALNEKKKNLSRRKEKQ